MIRFGHDMDVFAIEDSCFRQELCHNRAHWLSPKPVTESAVCIKEPPRITVIVSYLAVQLRHWTRMRRAAISLRQTDVNFSHTDLIISGIRTGLKLTQ